MPSPSLVASAVCCGFVIGLVPTLVDSVKAGLKERLGLPEPRVDRLLNVFYLCWLPAMPLAGWVLDHASNKEVLFFALLGIVLGVAWLALAPSRGPALGSIITLGVSYSCATTAGVRLMPEGLGFWRSNVIALNLGFLAVGLGALAGPLVVARVERWWGARQGLLTLSFAFLLPAALVAFSPADAFPRPAGTETWAQTFSHPQVGLIAVVILLYFALENCLEIWPQHYLEDLGFERRGVRVGLRAFWAAFLLSRLTLVWLAGPGYETWLLLLLVLVSSATLGNIAGAYTSNMGMVGFWVVGFCYGPLLPGFLALVLDFGLPATALGAALALSGLDTFIVRPAMTRYAKGHPARAVMRVPTLLALLLAAPLLVLALIRN